MINREYDKFGHFIVRKNPIFKTGILKYAPHEFGIDSDKPLVSVYRDPEQVKDVMDTLIGSPIIIDHEMLCGENGSVGYSCSLSENLKVIGSVIGNITIEDGIGYADISLWQEPKGDKKEFSVGFDAKFIDKSGTSENGENYDMIQVINIFNHLAFVTKGRAGTDVRILDTGEQMLDDDLKEMKESAKPTLEDVLQAIATLTDRVANLEKGEEGEEILDEMPKDKKDTPAVDSGMISEMIEKAVNASKNENDAKIKAYELGSKHVGAFSTATMDSGAVIGYVAEKLGIQKTLEAIEAYDQAVKAVGAKAAVGDPNNQQSGKEITAEALMAEFL